MIKYEHWYSQGVGLGRSYFLLLFYCSESYKRNLDTFVIKEKILLRENIRVSLPCIGAKGISPSRLPRKAQSETARG